MKTAVLRFDNYLIIFFPAPTEKKAKELHINYDGARHRPEFVFCRHAPGRNDRVNASAYFWIRDLAYATRETLGDIRLQDARRQPVFGRGTLNDLGHIEDQAYATWLRMTREAGLFDAFDCRYFPEIFHQAGRDEALAYLETCVEYVDADKLIRNVTQVAGEPACYRELYYYLFRYLTRKTLTYTETSLRDVFRHLSPDADVSIFEPLEIVQLFDLLRALDLQDVAVDKFCSFLRSRGWDRGTLKETIPELMPADSKWALRHVLGNPELGNEQAADMLFVYAREFEAGQDNAIAKIVREATRSLQPECRVGIQLDHGYRLAEMGDWGGAHEVFRQIDRGYAQCSIAGRVPWHLLVPGWSENRVHPRLQRGTLPRISIITPTLNQAEYIEQTLRSVLAQGYPNLQFIVVDGGSTDGTLDILERYRSQIHILMSEPDTGQSHAINKGLVVADGDLVGWLNSDDLLGPGALALLADAYCQEDAEVFAGICCEFKGTKVHTVNRPSLGPHGLHVSALGDIFDRWFSGEFFNQPEVFFKRSLVERVGLLDEDHTYAMDYDLWMRFAQRGARVCTVSWPFAFFRLHAKQKIQDRTATIEEQARIRDSYIDWQPGYDRRAAVHAKVRRHFETGGGHLHIVSSRMPKIFAAQYPEELPGEVGCGCSFVQRIDPGRVGERDMVIKLIHLQSDLDEIAAIRENAPGACLVGWFWDNHHHTEDNFRVAEALDIVIPGHSAFESYLRNHGALQLPTVPLSTTQWTRAEAASWARHIESCTRASALYGGYVEYGYSKRIDFLKAVQAELPDHNLYSIEERQLHKYFTMSPDARIKDWAAHMVSLVLPLRGDLSQRVFDALLTGQIPLVPDDLLALDQAFGTDAQYELPIVRFRYGDTESVKRAHARAVELFRKEGVDGIRRRHKAALDHHMFGARIRAIRDTLRQLDWHTSDRERAHA